MTNPYKPIPGAYYGTNEPLREYYADADALSILAARQIVQEAHDAGTTRDTFIVNAKKPRALPNKFNKHSALNPIRHTYAPSLETLTAYIGDNVIATHVRNRMVASMESVAA